MRLHNVAGGAELPNRARGSRPPGVRRGLPITFLFVRQRASELRTAMGGGLEARPKKRGQVRGRRAAQGQVVRVGAPGTRGVTEHRQELGIRLWSGGKDLWRGRSHHLARLPSVGSSRANCCSPARVDHPTASAIPRPQTGIMPRLRIRPPRHAGPMPGVRGGSLISEMCGSV